MALDRKKGIKYYAVVRGRVPGIYTSWDEARMQVVGFTAALHKSFSTLKDAEAFFNPSPTPYIGEDTGGVLPLRDRVVVYTDGSINKIRKSGGFGIVIVTPDGHIVKYYGQVPLPDCTSQAAELYAIYASLFLVEGPVRIISDSQTSIDILTTWARIKKPNTWRNVPNANLISAILELLSNRKVDFKHITAHAGYAFNEDCDRLAKMGAAQDQNLVEYERITPRGLTEDH